MDRNLVKKFEKYQSKARVYVEDKEKTRQLLKRATEKAEAQGPLEKIWDKLQLLFSLVKDWSAGNYRQIPVGSILMILAGLLYFVSPIDAILDFIPGLGITDDAVVLGFVIKQLGSELEKYRIWKANKED